MTALERLAITFAKQDVRQNSYRGADEVKQVLADNRYRRGLLIRQAGGANGGGTLHVRYESKQSFTAEQAIHEIPPGGQLTFIEAGATCPRQQVQVLFPADRTVCTVAEWVVRPPRKVRSLVESLNLQ